MRLLGSRPHLTKIAAPDRRCAACRHPHGQRGWPQALPVRRETRQLHPAGPQRHARDSRHDGQHGAERHPRKGRREPSRLSTGSRASSRPRPSTRDRVARAHLEATRPRPGDLDGPLADLIDRGPEVARTRRWGPDATPSGIRDRSTMPGTVAGRARGLPKRKAHHPVAEEPLLRSRRQVRVALEILDDCGWLARQGKSGRLPRARSRGGFFPIQSGGRP
jgi:hypothetical protein